MKFPQEKRRKVRRSSDENELTIPNYKPHSLLMGTVTQCTQKMGFIELMKKTSLKVS